MAAQPLPSSASTPRSSAWSAPSSGRAHRTGSTTRRGARRQVESLGSRVARPCQRNDCPAPARAGVELNHGDKVAQLVDLPGERDPRRMELCADHARHLTVPLGWDLDDARTDVETETPTGPPTAAELGSVSTLETLAAALHEPDEMDAAEAGAGDDQAADLARSGTDDADPRDDGGADTAAAIMAAVLDEPEAAGEPAPDPHAMPPMADETPAEATPTPGATARADEGHDERQLQLGGADDLARRPRPVPAARDTGA